MESPYSLRGSADHHNVNTFEDQLVDGPNREPQLAKAVGNAGVGSASDISMDSDSDSEEPRQKVANTLGEAGSSSSAMRDGLTPTGSGEEGSDTSAPGGSQSEYRPDRSLLPPEIWHHILTFIPPRTLGNLLRVNKLFNAYLLPGSAAGSRIPSSLPSNTLSYLKPDTIWRASRRLFWPRMPGPLRQHSELDMWRLLCSQHCQFCGLRAEMVSDGSDPWHSGPGSKGLSLIFAFAIASCGPCLVTNTMTVRPHP
jgi:hypothetical protein